MIRAALGNKPRIPALERQGEGGTEVRGTPDQRSFVPAGFANRAKSGSRNSKQLPTALEKHVTGFYGTFDEIVAMTAKYQLACNRGHEIFAKSEKVVA